MRPEIRCARAEDAVAISEIYAPVVRDSAISFELEPPDPEEMLRRMRAVLDDARAPWLVCSDVSGLLGYAYATKHRERAAYRFAVEVSVYVAEHARGRRVGAGLYTALLAILRAQGFHRAFAGITLPNAASVGLHESLGFRPLGTYKRVGFKFGAWHDVGWWDLDLAEPTDEPAEPVPFRDLAAPEVEAALERGAAQVRSPG